MARTARFVTVLGLVFVTLVAVALMPNTRAIGVNVPGILSVAFTGVFWAAVMAGGVWLALRVADAVSTARTSDRALSTLRERYARGEITRAEFFQMKQDLETNS